MPVKLTAVDLPEVLAILLKEDSERSALYFKKSMPIIVIQTIIKATKNKATTTGW
jgi:hypothetical protein